MDKTATKVSYFKGSDASKWKQGISTYDVVTLGEVYKGIDVTLKAYGNNVEKLFCVKPGANSDQIKIKLGGARELRVNKDGQLEAETELGPVKFTKPVAYQEIDGKKVDVEVDYTILNPNSKIQNPKSAYGFKVASYDKTKDLIIDPLLASTFLGEYYFQQLSYNDTIALDASGNVYVTGETVSSNFPTTPGAYDTSIDGFDVFVSKLDGGLTTLLASTFLGGSQGEGGPSLVLDTSGNVYVTGGTYSSDFPTTPGAYDTSFNSYSSGDAFISKLDGGLTTLLASTFLGGSNGEVGSFLALDTSGNVYVTGDTASWDFPTTPGAYDTSFGDGGIFISKLNGGLTTLLASTFLSGSDGGGSRSRSLALDTEGNVYVTGETYSSDFPTTPGAYDTSLNETDAFISKLNGGLTTLLASTFLGGYYYETGQSLALDTSGNVYVMGFTMSPDFPTTQVAYDTSFNGYRDFFISKLDGNLSAATTAIELASFEATVDKGAATLFWETATEVDNAGFNLYRAKSEDGDYAKINDTLIPARGNAVSGANYSFVDTPGKGTFYYKLEDVDYNGASAMHGPEKVRVREGDNAARHSKKARR
ncbi:MAG: hypothetical protein UZ01_00020 [Candidatus Brocadia sinica]|nr:MAG: hypothetical protein UZ01_00020 [Candidatus Brocadia sinica]